MIEKNLATKSKIALPQACPPMDRSTQLNDSTHVITTTSLPRLNERVSLFVIVADVWDECASRWLPGQSVPTVRLVKGVVESVTRPTMSAGEIKSAALSILYPGPQREQ